ncbi:MAG: DUF2730 family protein [Roseiarcus sp.]
MPEDVWETLTALGSLSSVVLSLYTLLTARNQKDVADLLDAKNDHEKRLAVVETTVEHLPSADVVHDLNLAMADMKGQLAVIVERVGPIKAIAERLQETFLEHGR